MFPANSIGSLNQLSQLVLKAILTLPIDLLNFCWSFTQSNLSNFSDYPTIYGNLGSGGDRHCNEYICKVHQTRPTLVRDLSGFGRSVYLKIPRRQFYCHNCKIFLAESFTWLNKRQRQTNRYQEYIYERVSVAGDPHRKELTVKQVSENENMCVAGYPRRSEDAVQDQKCWMIEENGNN